MTKVRNVRVRQTDKIYRLNDIPFDVDSLPKVGGPLLKKVSEREREKERGGLSKEERER